MGLLYVCVWVSECIYDFKLKRKHTLKSSALKIKASGWLLFFSSFLFSFLFLFDCVRCASVCMHFPMSIAFALLFCCCCFLRSKYGTPTTNIQCCSASSLSIACTSIFIHTWTVSTVHCAYTQPHNAYMYGARTWKNSREREQAATEAIVIAEGNWHCKSNCGQCLFVWYLIANVYHHHTQSQHLLFLDCYFSLFISLLL